MANLPENQTYIKSNNVPIPQVPNLRQVTSSAPKVQNSGPGSFQDLMSRMDQFESGGAQGPSAPAAPAFDAMNYTMRPNTAPPAIPAGNLLTNSPSLSTPLGTSGYQATWDTSYGGKTPSEQAILRTVGKKGQYVSDPANPDSIIESVRISEDPQDPDYNPKIASSWLELKRTALEGRSSRLYAVDHAIPLWLGGTNTEDNLQVLSRPKHGEKTKAESVALTLFANGVIDRDEAFYLATTWDNRDLSIVPAPEKRPEYSEGQTTGQIPLSKAIEIRNTWKMQESAKPKIKFKDFWGALRSNPLLYGFSKGLTAGAVKESPDMPTGGLNTVLQTGGQIAGTLLTVVGLGKVFGMAKNAVATRGIVANTLNKTGVIKAATDTVSKVSVFKPNVAVNMADALKAAQRQNFWKWTPPVVTYGQVSETFEEDPARVTRLAEDIIYGNLTGYFKPDLRGATKTAVTVGAVSLIADTFNNRTDNLAENALINAVTMGVLHGISAPGVRKQAEETLKNESTRTAHNVLSMYIPKVRAVDQKTPPPTYSLQEIDQMEDELARSLSRRLAGESDNDLPPMSEEEFIQQSQVIDAAFDTLRLGSMKGSAADNFAAQKLQQFIKTVNSKTDREQFFGGVIPTGRVTRIVENMPQDLADAAIPYTPSQTFLSGTMRSTGLAKNFHPDPQGLAEFIAQPQNNYKTVVAIRRPEREGLNRFLSQSDENDWIDENPANTIQLIGITKKEGGGVQYTNLGYVPQQNRIAAVKDGGRPNSINEQSEIKQGKFPAYDVNFNKDSLSGAMDKEGLDYLFVTLKNYGYEGSTSGKPNFDFPFVEFSVGENNWTRSIEWQKGAGKLKPSVVEDGAESVLSRANTTTNTEIRQEAINEYVTNQPNSAATALNLDNPVIQSFDTGGLSQLKSHLSMAEDALTAPDAATMASKMKQYFDVNLDETQASSLFARRDTFTVDDLFTEIKEKSSPIVKEIILGDVKPNFDAIKNSDEWELRQVFNKMHIVGKPEPKNAMVMPPREDVTVSPALQNVEVGAANDLPTATVGEAVPSTRPTVALTPPTQPSPAAQALVNKAAELGIVPPTAAVKPVATPIITLDPKKYTPQIIEAASIVIPQGGARSSRQAHIDEITNSTISEGQLVLKEIPYRERLGIEGYKKQLLGVVNTIEPTLSRNPKAPMKGDATTGDLNLPLTANEKNAIRADVKNHLSQVALATYRDKATLDNELYFKLLGFKKGDDDYELVKSMQDALDAETFGFRRELQTLRQELGDDEFERVFRIINEKADDSIVKSLGKPPAEKDNKARTPLGIKTGLLRDPERTFIDPKTNEKIAYDADASDARVNSANSIIADFIDKPKSLPEGSYMRVMSDVLETAFASALGPKWRTDATLRKRLAEGSWNNVWDDLLKNSDSEATQPKDYIRALGKGQRTEARNLQSARSEEQHKVAQEVSNRKLGGRAAAMDEGPTSDDVMDDALIDQMSYKERTQADDSNIPAPAKIDRKMAGLTTAIDEDIDPTPELAMNDAIQLLFEFLPGKMNTAIADSAVASVLSKLEAQGIRTSNVKNPTKKVGQYFADARSANKQANELVKGELGKRFKSLLNSKSMSGIPYSDWSSVKKAETPIKKIIALGEAISRNVYDVELGKKSDHGNLKRTTKEELLFLDSYRKYKNLLDQVGESKRAQEIMKVDDKVVKSKKKDGQGYPGPMDGQGGFFGDAWDKVKGIMSNTNTYERPKPDASLAGMELLKPESPHLMGRGTQKPAEGLRFRDKDITQEDYEDISRIMYGEISNRPDDKRRLEAQVIMNVAANRVGKKGFANNDSLPNVFRSPNQFQGYAPDGIEVDGKKTRSQYQKVRDGELDDMSKQKYEEIRRMLRELANEPDITNGATFYVHAKDGSIWYGNTLDEAINNATNHEARKGLKLSWKR